MCRLHICEDGPSFARPLGLQLAPHRRPQGLFLFLSGAARAERAPHVRRPRTGSPRTRALSPLADIAVRHGQRQVYERCGRRAGARLLSRDPSPRATDRRPFRLTSRGHTDVRLALPVAAGHGGLRHPAGEGHPDPDASKWPLLLKNYDKLMVRPQDHAPQSEPTEGSREGFAADGPREKKQDASPDRFATPDSDHALTLHFSVTSPSRFAPAITRPSPAATPH